MLNRVVIKVTMEILFNKNTIYNKNNKLKVKLIRKKKLFH